MKVALDSFRVLLFDQRGTGRSTPATPQHILSIGSPEAQAEYMSHFRADSIVNDCEIVRDKIAGGKRLTLIGQSFGGFCMLRYLSAYPDAIERCLFTCGLAPVGKPVEEVYRATFKRMEKRNARFYRPWTSDVRLFSCFTSNTNPNTNPSSTSNSNSNTNPSTNTNTNPNTNPTPDATTARQPKETGIETALRFPAESQRNARF